MHRSLLIAATMLATLLSVFSLAIAEEKSVAKKKDRVFEMRIYTTHTGKLDALHARFRDHTNKLFKKHGMDLVAYWTPQDDKTKSLTTLIYVLAYPSREARDKSWKGFLNDPVWKKAYKESHKDGPIVMKVESTFMTPTDYSPIK